MQKLPEARPLEEGSAKGARLWLEFYILALCEESRARSLIIEKTRGLAMVRLEKV